MTGLIDLLARRFGIRPGKLNFQVFADVNGTDAA